MPNEPEGLNDYIECALWSSHDVVDDEDVNLDDYDLAPGVREALAVDLADFLAQDEVAALLEQLEISAGQAAHDFWLTRNGHGCGFWDRGNGAAGDRLTELCRPYGGQDLYLADDGLVWAAGLEPRWNGGFVDAAEIIRAVDAGRSVKWANDGYDVIKDSLGQYLIVCKSNGHAIGLTWLDGVTLNGRPEDFYMKEKP